MQWGAGTPRSGWGYSRSAEALPGPHMELCWKAPPTLATARTQPRAASPCPPPGLPAAPPASPCPVSHQVEAALLFGCVADPRPSLLGRDPASTHQHPSAPISARLEAAPYVASMKDRVLQPWGRPGGCNVVSWGQCPPGAPGRAHGDGAALGTPMPAGPSLSEQLFRGRSSGPEVSCVNMQWDGMGVPSPSPVDREN